MPSNLQRGSAAAIGVLRAVFGAKRIDGLRKSEAYELYRRWRGQDQLGNALAVLDGLDPSGALYSRDLTRQRLLNVALKRRSIRAGAPLNVIAYGDSDWEDKGLWQAARRLGESSLFEPKNYPAGSESKLTHRKRTGREFITHLADFERRFGPVHLVFFYKGGIDLDPSMLAELRTRGIWTALMGLDDKQQLPGPPLVGISNWQLNAARNVDLYWTTWRTGADWLTQRGVTTWYAPPGADPDFFHPIEAVSDLDAVWVGRAYGPRHGLVRYVQSHGIKVTAVGPGWPGGPVDFEEMIRLFSRAKVVLGMGGIGQTDEFKTLKGRDFEVAMCGSLYLTSFNPELAEHFDVGKEILCYGSPFEAVDTLRYILRRPEEATRIRTAARARSLADHTWDKRFSDLKNLLTVG